jgi:hypothetical protein
MKYGAGDLDRQQRKKVEKGDALFVCDTRWENDSLRQIETTQAARAGY